jgi:hypothetical protein
MKTFRRSIAGLSFGVALACLSSGSGASAQDISYKQDPNAAQGMTLLLKDFDPKPMLHTEVHAVNRAKFPVIDVHNHVNDPGGVHGEEIDPAEVVWRMDATNVKTIVILTGQWGDKLQGVLDKMVKPYPGRFVVFTQMDWSEIDDPDFSQKMGTFLGNGASALANLAFGPGRKDAVLDRQDRQTSLKSPVCCWLVFGCAL